MTPARAAALRPYPVLLVALAFLVVVSAGNMLAWFDFGARCRSWPSSWPCCT